MSDFAISGPDRDLVIQGGQLVLVKNADARRQRIDVAIYHMQGEWFLDENAGTDWFGKVLGKSTEMSRRAEFRRRILGVPGVVEVTELALRVDPRTRKLSGSIRALDVTAAPLDVTIVGVV